MLVKRCVVFQTASFIETVEKFVREVKTEKYFFIAVKKYWRPLQVGFILHEKRFYYIITNRRKKRISGYAEFCPHCEDLRSDSMLTWSEGLDGSYHPYCFLCGCQSLYVCDVNEGTIEQKIFDCISVRSYEGSFRRTKRSYLRFSRRAKIIERSEYSNGELNVIRNRQRVRDRS